MSAQHHDLAQAPYRPSQVLVDFAAAQQQRRRQEAAQRDATAQRAEFRRSFRGSPSVRAVDAMVSQLPPPAFRLVSGQRAHGLVEDPQAKSFAAGGTDRFSAGWTSLNTGINSDLEAALSTLRARSRDWWVNTDTGARYGQLVLDNVIGAEAPRLQVRALMADGKTQDEAANTAIEEAWWQWCQMGNCEITGHMDFTDVCRAVLAQAARDGEYLTRRLRDKRWTHGFALQLLDVDRIDTQKNTQPATRGTNAIRLGIEIDTYGRAAAAWLLEVHPGDYGAGLAAKGASGRVPMSELLHGFIVRRPEQVRGYPWASPVLRSANLLDTFKQYAVVAAKVGAAKMGFYVTDAEALNGGLKLEELKDATGELVQDVEAGMLEALPPGVRFEAFNPDYPHQNYGPFVTLSQRDLASGLNVAHHNLTGDMTGVTYSSARIAELNERRHWRSIQRWFIASFVRPVFEDWLRMALLTGSIKLPSGSVLPAERFDKFAMAATFQPPSWPWVDPEADMNSAAKRLTYDLASLRQLADENNVDLQEVLRDKAALKKQYEDLGLPVPAWIGGGAAMTVSGTPKPAPAPAPTNTGATA